MPDYPPGAGDPPGVAWWGTRDFADSMKGEIWRYRRGKWERVHQSPEFSFPGAPPYLPAGTYPVAYGYRAMAEFNGYVYACGIGTWMPPLPINTVIRSATGNPGTWEDVSQNIGNGLTTNIRGIAVWNNKLYISASTPAPLGGVSKAVVYESADPKTQGWKLVNVPGFGGNNSEIYYLTSFNNHLYASTVNLVDGFELWKTDGTVDPNDPQGRYVWTPVITNGFGDSWNQYGMTMAVLGDKLYLGTAVGIGMVMKNNEVVGSRAIEIIRVDKNDNAELIVGASEASDPRPGGPNPRVPISGKGAGFGNPFNVYAWNMNTFKGCLYVGTFDMSVFVLGLLQENPEMIKFFLEYYAPSDLDFPPEIANALINSSFMPATLDLMMKLYGGGDVWKSCDGINWRPVTQNGFGNPLNYGIRELVPYRDQALAVGTANPFTGRPTGGCEGWLAKASCHS